MLSVKPKLYKEKTTNEPIIELEVNMKTKNQTEHTPGVAARRNTTTRTAGASRVPQREQAADENGIRPFHVNVPEGASPLLPVILNVEPAGRPATCIFI